MRTRGEGGKWRMRTKSVMRDSTMGEECKKEGKGAEGIYKLLPIGVLMFTTEHHSNKIQINLS